VNLDILYFRFICPYQIHQLLQWKSKTIKPTGRGPSPTCLITKQWRALDNKGSPLDKKEFKSINLKRKRRHIRDCL